MSEQYGVRWPDGQVTRVKNADRARGYARIWQRTGAKAQAVVKTGLLWLSLDTTTGKDQT